MGWTGKMSEIPIGMLFKKMYCRKCGVQLKVNKISKTVKKGEEGFTKHLTGNNSTIGMSELELISYAYKCPQCGCVFTYDEQLVIAKRQKQLKKRIISDNEMT